MLGEEEKEVLDARRENSSPPAGGARDWWFLDAGALDLFNDNSSDIFLGMKFYRYLVETYPVCVNVSVRDTISNTDMPRFARSVIHRFQY